jgi:hypothetical protein
LGRQTITGVAPIALGQHLGCSAPLAAHQREQYLSYWLQLTFYWCLSHQGSSSIRSVPSQMLPGSSSSTHHTQHLSYLRLTPEGKLVRKLPIAMLALSWYHLHFFVGEAVLILVCGHLYLYFDDDVLPYVDINFINAASSSLQLKFGMHQLLLQPHSLSSLPTAHRADSVCSFASRASDGSNRRAEDPKQCKISMPCLSVADPQ